MDIAVVDDEKVMREYLCELIKKQKPESRIESYVRGEELLASGSMCLMHLTCMRSSIF